MISGLLTFDDSKRLRAKEALDSDLFQPRSQILNLPGNVPPRSLEDLLVFSAFTTQVSPGETLNSVKKGMLSFIVQRVIPESSFAYYKDVFRHIEGLCSASLDGLLRLNDI